MPISEAGKFNQFSIFLWVADEYDWTITVMPCNLSRIATLVHFKPFLKIFLPRILVELLLHFFELLKVDVCTINS